MIASRIAAGALIVAVALFAGAWQLQTTAAADLAEAERLQAEEVDGGGGEPPKVSHNRQIVEVLRESIDIRRDIEGDLVAIEEAVHSLQARQLEAAQTTASARSELAGIADALASSVAASRASSDGLAALTSRLETSARLAALIAEELEELDRKMGPRAAGPR